MKMSSLALVALVGCRGGVPEASSKDAGSASIIAPDASVDAATGAASASASAVVAAPSDAGVSATDASVAVPDGELALVVQGGNCPPDRRSTPGCRSYTYTLRSDGKLRGSQRRTDVPADEVRALFDSASEAFGSKYTCVPNAPDRGSQAITFRLGGKTRTASGGCGARFDDIKARLEKLALP